MFRPVRNQTGRSLRLMLMSKLALAVMVGITIGAIMLAALAIVWTNTHPATHRPVPLPGGTIARSYSPMPEPNSCNHRLMVCPPASPPASAPTFGR